jgi:hypothetical protein
MQQLDIDPEQLLAEVDMIQQELKEANERYFSYADSIVLFSFISSRSLVGAIKLRLKSAKK